MWDCLEKDSILIDAFTSTAAQEIQWQVHTSFKVFFEELRASKRNVSFFSDNLFRGLYTVLSRKSKLEKYLISWMERNESSYEFEKDNY